MNLTATMPVPAKEAPKIIALSEPERALMQNMLDNHALTLTEKLDTAIEEDNYTEAKRLVGTLAKTIECLGVLTK